MNSESEHEKEEFPLQLRKYIYQKSLNNCKLRRLQGGINSNVYLITSQERKFIYKKYRQDSRYRLEKEVKFLQLLDELDINSVPKVLDVNLKEYYTILSYVEGHAIEDVTPSVINESTSLIKQIYPCRKINNKLYAATDACFNIRDHIKITSNKFETASCRLNDIEDLPNNEAKRIARKLKTILNKSIDSIDSQLREGILKQQVCTEEVIGSPSDVGSHNMLSARGEYFFVDFEYAGWDDIAKFAIDWLIHPNHILNDDLTTQLLNNIYDFIPREQWLIRILALLELYQIKWSLIILNPLLHNSGNNICRDEILEKLNKSEQYLIRASKRIESQKSIIRDFLNNRSAAHEA